MSLKIRVFLILTIVSFLLQRCSSHDDNPSPGAAGQCRGMKADVEKIPVFPSSNAWNKDISAAELDRRSDDIIGFLSGTGAFSMKANFGAGLYEGVPIGIPYVVVCGDQATAAVKYRADDYDGNYGDESDQGPFPIPLDAPIEENGKGDSHVIAVDIDNKKLYELYNASVSGSGWEASSGAVFDLASNTQRPTGWTSADGAGLPIFAGLVRYDELATGTIDHARRFTLSRAKVMAAYTAPASHIISGSNHNENSPTPVGMRLRLKNSKDISGYSQANQVILRALKKYGLILADIGSNGFITGGPDERWNNDDLQKLGGIKITDFEVVKMGEIITE